MPLLMKHAILIYAHLLNVQASFGTLHIFFLSVIANARSCNPFEFVKPRRIVSHGGLVCPLFELFHFSGQSLHEMS